MAHWNKERFIDKKTAFIFKNQVIICYKCDKEIIDKLVVKRTKRTRHYHQSCYEKLFH
jgi:flavorubredoxin